MVTLISKIPMSFYTYDNFFLFDERFFKIDLFEQFKVILRFAAFELKSVHSAGIKLSAI